MLPQVQLPVPLAEIPQVVEALRAHVSALRAEERVTVALIEAVREACPHKDLEHWTDRSGVGCSRCKHCGKEW